MCNYCTLRGWIKGTACSVLIIQYRTSKDSAVCLSHLYCIVMLELDWLEAYAPETVSSNEPNKVKIQTQLVKVREKSVTGRCAWGENV